MTSKGALPDLRFEQTFRLSLKKESMKQNKLALSAEDGSLVDPPITPYVVAKVVIKDVLVGSFVQGVVFTSFLIICKPWLRMCASAGRNLAVRLFGTITGRDLIRRRPAL